MTRYDFDKSCTNAVKGIAVILLICHHLFTNVLMIGDDAIPSLVFSNGGILNIGAFGKICVCIFTFLTAYGMTLRISKITENSQNIGTDLWKYSLKRYISLMGMFLFAYLIALVLFINKLSISDIYGRGISGMYNAVVDILGLAVAFSTPTLNPTWWYMSLAIILIIIIPGLVLLYDKINKLIIPLCFMLGFFFQVAFPQFCYFGIPMLSVAIGICAAKENWISRFCEYRFKNGKSASLCKMIVLIVLFAVIYYLRTRLLERNEVLMLTEGVFGYLLSVVICYFSRQLKWLCKALAYVGSLSADIFFIHSMFIVYYSGVIYRGCTELAFITLFALSMAVAIIMKLIKKFTKYDVLVSKLASSVSK